MRPLPEAETGPTSRIRRWDAVILGSSLPGLIAAARLGMQGGRVLVLEEKAAGARPDCLREPFWTGGVEKGSVLGVCLRELRVPLIDQRRIEPDPLAFQLILRDARIDVGSPSLTADEWVAWGLAMPAEARALVSNLLDAADAEGKALADSPMVRGGRRGSRGSGRSGDSLRTLARRLADAPPRIAKLLEAQVRALSNLGAVEPSDSARAWLLGAPLAGGASIHGEDSLRDVLRRRIVALYGEIRPLPDTFRLVSAGGQPGVAPDAAGESGEVWVGRAFVFNAPRAALAGAVAQDPPECLQVPEASHRRVSLHLQVEREALPEAMASRVVIVGDESQPLTGTQLICVRRSGGANGGPFDLVASAVLPVDEAEREGWEQRIGERVAELLPFAGNRLVRVPAPKPRWDDDAWLADPAPEAGWPALAELRLPSRQPIYSLERATVAGLGFEGDLLLGWRGGDAIAADLG